MSAPAAVFLDLDGCLVDSTLAITRSINHALAAVGIAERPTEDLLRFIGPPAMSNFRVLLAEEGRDEALAPACVDAYRQRYRAVATAETEVFPGIVEALATLGRRSPLAVVTSKPRPIAEPLLVALGLRDAFTHVHGPELDAHAESKTVTLTRAIDALAVAATATVMVGDREYDVLAGRACATGTVGVLWGAGARNELERAGADALAPVPADLPEVVLAVSRARSASR
jgi:phosphoglycolate phosphatase